MKDKSSRKIVTISLLSLIGLISILLFVIGPLVTKPLTELSLLAKECRLCRALHNRHYVESFVMWSELLIILRFGALSKKHST